jgi:GNAT superfamily N-acetyltransferase
VDLQISPLTAERWPALEDLFGRAGASNGCWCMYWRIGPRYHDRPRSENKRDRSDLAARGHSGLLAFDADLTAGTAAGPTAGTPTGPTAGTPTGLTAKVAVGWCELAPRAELAWLARARHLEPVDDLPVWSIPCFYVRRSHRGRGITEALIEAAVVGAAAAGAPALEAYPVDTTVPGHTRNLFPGTASAFARHGFTVVARRKPDRPVMRRTLAVTAA